jgi:hypothetical protein
MLGHLTIAGRYETARLTPTKLLSDALIVVKQPQLDLTEYRQGRV